MAAEVHVGEKLFCLIAAGKQREKYQGPTTPFKTTPYYPIQGHAPSDLPFAGLSFLKVALTSQ